MAIHHALSGELIDVRPLGGKLAATTTRTLYKSEHLEVFRMILPAGKAMPAHRVDGEVTVQSRRCAQAIWFAWRAACSTRSKPSKTPRCS